MTMDARNHDESTRERPAGRPEVGSEGYSDGAGALQRLLALRDILARVESRGTLAVVVPATYGPAIDVATRRWIVQAAQEAGFTHVALEVLPDPTEVDAPLPGRHPA